MEKQDEYRCLKCGKLMPPELILRALCLDCYEAERESQAAWWANRGLEYVEDGSERHRD